MKNSYKEKSQKEIRLLKNQDKSDKISQATMQLNQIIKA